MLHPHKATRHEQAGRSPLPAGRVTPSLLCLPARSPLLPPLPPLRWGPARGFERKQQSLPPLSMPGERGCHGCSKPRLGRHSAASAHVTRLKIQCAQ